MFNSYVNLPEATCWWNPKQCIVNELRSKRSAWVPVNLLLPAETPKRTQRSVDSVRFPFTSMKIIMSFANFGCYQDEKKKLDDQ